MNIFRILSLSALLLPAVSSAQAEDGYELWLRYRLIEESVIREDYNMRAGCAVITGTAAELESARKEYTAALRGMLGSPPELLDDGWEGPESVDDGWAGPESVDDAGMQPELVGYPGSRQDRLADNGSAAGLSEITAGQGCVIAGTPSSNKYLSEEQYREKAVTLGREGYTIFNERIAEKECIVVLASEPAGVLYGVFHLIRLMQTGQDLSSLDIIEKPLVKYRLLNHWDNLDGTVERGYAGFSIWDWHRLPEYTSPRYTDYARANASIGINGTVLTNVNANSFVLKPSYLDKVAALADVFRPYGIRVYLTARFSAPVELGHLPTADPLDPAVIQWWSDKAGEIYRLVPDFGGFLVKANSEGQPGPGDYGRSHAEGANMLADALAPHGGIVMWRAFVYSHEVPDDRAGQAYNEFVPLDGSFRDNVIIQVKNGPIDFQPREPFHPLFGAMPGTPLGMEFQITQEYLGQGTHLVYLAPMYKECLDSDTRAKGEGSPVSGVIDGSLYGFNTSCMAGVANTGTDRNWTGHHFGQANWYAFGRLAWNHSSSPKQIATEWLRMNFGNNKDFIGDVREIMLRSREIAVQYMTPLGLHHIMDRGHHYGPGPWINGGRPDWTSVYYHRASAEGIGFDRTATGSGVVEQYHEEIAGCFSDPESCPDKYLLWFHHLSWDHPMKSGRTLWEEICHSYHAGSDSAAWMQKVWKEQEGRIDAERFGQVSDFLAIQASEAAWWRDACLSYFQSISKRPIPEGLEKPEKSLEEYMNMKFPYAPGISPR
jgi:alpha-glucuronidase